MSASDLYRHAPIHAPKHMCPPTCEHMRSTSYIQCIYLYTYIQIKKVNYAKVGYFTQNSGFSNMFILGQESAVG